MTTDPAKTHKTSICSECGATLILVGRGSEGFERHPARAKCSTISRKRSRVVIENSCVGAGLPHPDLAWCYIGKLVKFEKTQTGCVSVSLCEHPKTPIAFISAECYVSRILDSQVDVAEIRDIRPAKKGHFIYF